MHFYKSKVMILRTGFWIKDKQDSCRRSSNNKTSRGVSSLSFTNWAVWTQSMVSEREERISTVPQSLWLFDRTLLLIRIDTNLSVAIKYRTFNTFLIRWRFDWVIKDDENPMTYYRRQPWQPLYKSNSENKEEEKNKLSVIASETRVPPSPLYTTTTV